jgi:hypothetical protein
MLKFALPIVTQVGSKSAPEGLEETDESVV